MSARRGCEDQLGKPWKVIPSHRSLSPAADWLHCAPASLIGSTSLEFPWLSISLLQGSSGIKVVDFHLCEVSIATQTLFCSGSNRNTVTRSFARSLARLNFGRLHHSPRQEVYRYLVQSTYIPIHEGNVFASSDCIWGFFLLGG